MVSKCT